MSGTPEPPPLVLVIWEDATVLDTGAWADNGKHDYKPCIFHQVGFLIAHSDAGVILSSAWHPETVAARDQIPRGMIRSMSVLEPAKPPRKRK